MERRRRLGVVALLAGLGAASAPAVSLLALDGAGSVATAYERGVGPGTTRTYAVQISSIDSTCFLAAEMWYDRPRDAPTPDPILMVAKDKKPMVFYSTAGVLDTDQQIATNATFYDERAFMLTRDRQFVSVPPAQLEPGRWFVTVTNVPVWSSGMLNFHLEMRLSDTPLCQASCSGHGTCRSEAECAREVGLSWSNGHRAPHSDFSAATGQGWLVSPRSACTGSCACQHGWGGVDCATLVHSIMPLADGSDTPATVPLSAPTIAEVDVPLGTDPEVLATAADADGWRYYSVTVDGDDQQGGALVTVSPGGMGSAQMNDPMTVNNLQVSRGLAGFISAELQLPTVAGMRPPPPTPPPGYSVGWTSSPSAAESNSGAESIEGCQALLFFKHEDDGFTRLPSHYDFQKYSDPVAFYGGLARFHVDLALRNGRYIVGVYTTPPSTTTQGASADNDTKMACAPAKLTLLACPSGNAVECRYYGMGSSSAQARLFVFMLLAAALPILCCLPALFCHVLAWLTGSDANNDGDGAQTDQYQRIDAPRPGLTTAELAAHTMPIVFDGPLPRQLQGEHCSICIGEFKGGEGLRQLKCSHFFHAECIDEWLSRVDICPLCKSSAVQGPNPPAATGEAVGMVAEHELPAQIDLEANSSQEAAAETMHLLDEPGSNATSEEESQPEPEPESDFAFAERNPMSLQSSSP